MTTRHAEPYISVPGQEEPLLLLASTPVAWVAYCLGTRPLLVPVNVAVLDGEVVFRSGYGDKLAAAAGCEGVLRRRARQRRVRTADLLTRVMPA